MLKEEFCMMSWTGLKSKVETVGLVGCGRMGICMLEVLLKGGFKVVAYDAFAQAMERAATMGAVLAASPMDLAQKVDLVIMSLPGPVQIEQVLFAENGIVWGLGKGKVVVDTSTVDPKTTKDNAERLEQATGSAYLDCPILGRPSATGKWMLPTGGNKDALEYAKPALLTFAANAISVGEHGAGNALKLLNQMMFTCINAISSEVMAIAEHVGVDPKVFYNTVASSSAATVSGLFREVGKCIIQDEFDHPAFTVDLLIKDTKLALQMAKDSDAPSVIAGFAHMYNELAHANGHGNEDTSAVYKVFAKQFEKERD